MHFRLVVLEVAMVMILNDECLGKQAYNCEGKKSFEVSLITKAVNIRSFNRRILRLESHAFDCL